MVSGLLQLFTSLSVLLFSRLTKEQIFKLKVEMTDVEGRYRRADYDTFKITSDATYNVMLDGFHSDISWQTRNAFEEANGMAFSAPGRDNDNAPYDCAARYGTGNW